MKKEVPAIHLGMSVPAPKGIFGGRKFLGVICGFIQALSLITVRTPGGFAKITISAKGGLAIDLTKLESSQEASSDDGWKWASPINFNEVSPYLKGRVVVVLPTDSIVIDGAIDAETGSLVHAVPGAWVALRNVPAGSTESGFYLPQWPLPQSSETAFYDVGAPQNYWWPTSVYPKEITCDTERVIANYQQVT